MASTEGPHENDACRGCALVDRRDFLRDASVAVVSVLVALGASPRIAAAAPIRFVSPIGGSHEDKSYPIPAGDGTQIDKSNEVMVTRWQGKVYAFALSCPHQNTALKWSEKDHQFECPKHHSRFEPDGVYIKDSGRATRGLDRFAVRKDAGNIVVNLDKLLQEDDNEAEWKTAFVNAS
jgi:nitrite reductase/ring-hydroxylating ferredoxin subunit